jgi:hypothetical protein
LDILKGADGKEELAAKIFKEMNPEKVVTDFAY